ncbi:PREDICTED: uncharacterized protein LOC109339538 [Lupinus angustifolius]|uniref:uncharacterized protein LOC109339538 n=1 Tax=Lupinus angustifolius TaxID=3871 RepID=UPI00092E9B64|nr:PREDICTED: uncharacterized protein LOC109339538 [Lupinus angustifolius]
MEDVNDLFWDELNLKFFAHNDRGSLLPNLWGLCNKSLSPAVIASLNQYIVVSLTMDNKVVHLCAVYAHSHYIQRRALWEDIIKTNLVHLVSRGAEFTWSNRRRGSALTEKRLDRSLCNDDWLSNWNSVYCCTLPRISSDHHPLLLCSSSSMTKRNSPFRFLKMWMKHPDCSRVTEEAWKDEIVGCPMFIVAEKLKRLKVKLKIWNWNTFGNIHQRVREALSQVENIQSCINNDGPNDELLDQEGITQLNLLKALSMEDDFWKEKS